MRNNTGGRTCGTEAKRDPRCTWPARTGKTKAACENHGLTSALFRETTGLDEQATFDNVESKFQFTRCVHQGDVEVPRLGLKNGHANSVERRTRMDEKKWEFMFAHVMVEATILSHSKTNLEKMMKDLIEEAETWDLKPKHHCCRKEGGHDDQKKKRTTQITVRKKLEGSGIHLQIHEENARQLGENARCEQSLVERREDLQKQRYTMANKMQKNGGPSLQRILFWE